VSGLPVGAAGGADGRPLPAALDYAARGWAVFPLHSMVSGRCSCRRDCSHPAKHPIARHGVREATTDEGTIRSWWDRWPWANVGVATGADSRIVVIDVDPANGGTHSLTNLQALMGNLPDTLTARTGGGGLHLVYRHPGGQIRNTAGRLPGVDDPLPGIDLRGDGGYIVAPPSRHRSGACYTWLDPTAAVSQTPGWLRAATPRPFPTARTTWHPPVGSGSRYGLAALQAEATDVRRSAVGERNNRLNRAAFCLGTLVAGGELDETIAGGELLAAAVDAGLPEREATASIRSGLRAGAREPRRRPAG